MGFRFNRLSMAIILAVSTLSGYVIAAEQDDFYIEIKGPAKSDPSKLQPAANPVSSSAPANNRAKPYIPETNRTGYDSITAETTAYGPIRSTETAWSISDAIRRAHPGSGLTTPQVLNALKRKNSGKFVGRNRNVMLAGVTLAIPSLREIRLANQAPVTVKKPVIELVKIPEPEKKQPQLKVELKKVEPPVKAVAPETPIQHEDKPVVSEHQNTDRNVVASTEPNLVDSKVQEIVSATPDSHAVTAQPDPNLEKVQTENQALKDKIQQLNAQIGHLQSSTENQEILKKQIEELQAQLLALKTEPSQEADTTKHADKPAENHSSDVHASTETPKTTDNSDEPKVEDKSDTFGELMKSPLNLLLLVSLPVLAILVVVSFWLRARAKKELAAKEQEMAETTALLMDEQTSDFGDLLAVDLSSDNEAVPEIEMPDLNEAEEAVFDKTDENELEQTFADSVELSIQDDAETFNSETASADIESIVDFSEIDLSDDINDVQLPNITPKEEPDFSSLISDDDLSALFDQNNSEPVADANEGSSFLINDDDLAAMLAEDDSPKKEVEVDNSADLTAEPEIDFDAFAAESDEADFDFDSLGSISSAESESDIEFDTLLNSTAVTDLEASSVDENQVKETKTPPALEESITMNDQIVSLPDGWDVESEDLGSTASASPFEEKDVSLIEVNDDSEKAWVKQFESDTPQKPFLTIDELLAETEKEDNSTVDSLQANLDVGLDEFPDMLPQHDGVDIDDDGGIGAKLDLARAYLEIDDKDSAKELLLEVQAQGNDVQAQDANKLLARLG